MNDQQSNTTQPVVPDSDTTERLKNLAYVGEALGQTASDNTFHTNFYLAKEALSKFKQGLDKLQIDTVSRKGLQGLIEYLDKKIDRRIKNADTTGDRPLT